MHIHVYFNYDNFKSHIVTDNIYIVERIYQDKNKINHSFFNKELFYCKYNK